MLKIQRSANGRVVFTLSGEIGDQQIDELDALVRSDDQGRPIVLDLKDVTLVGREAIGFLDRCEADGVTLKNCPPYVREWITRNRHKSKP
jgi:anti-anti-sigma regulatory factor